MSRLARVASRGLLVLGTLLALAVATGASYQAVGAVADRERLPPPGVLVDVGGRFLHLHCTGNGEPTVVVEAGAMDFSAGWILVQEAVAETTRICTYDRAGVGWSDPSRHPQDGERIVADLEVLLERSRVPGPFVLVGHSLGGLLARIFYGRNPESVAGFVLVEPGDPAETLESFPGGPEEPLGGAWWESAGAVAARLGVIRWFYRDKLEVEGFPPASTEAWRAGIARPEAGAALVSTIRYTPVTCHQAATVPSLGDRPLVLLYSTRFDEIGTSFENEQERREFRRGWIEVWTAMPSLSSQGRPPYIIEGANHLTIVRDPRYAVAVVAAIEEVVAEVRAAGRRH